MANSHCHSDQLHTQAAELTQLSEKDSELRTPRVHKGVHRRALRMVSLGRDSRGNYKARKRLPGDVREEYGRLYGPTLEAKFHAPADTKRQDAERQFHEWEAETNARIAAIRAERKGEGIPLARQQARALAGEFRARHPVSDREHWQSEHRGLLNCKATF